MRAFRFALFAGIAGAAMIASGCLGGSRSAQPRTVSYVMPTSAAVAALAPAIYMQLASSSSLFAMRASQLAVERSQSSQTRSAAEAILRDQGGVAAQLSYAGRRLELLPSAALSDAQTAELERMRQSSDFDSDFRRSVTDQLARALEAHQAFARSGSSPTLRPVAQMAAPVTRRNLDALRR